MSVEQTCRKCRKIISRRAKANIWNGKQVVCTDCLHKLQREDRRHEVAIGLAGQAGADWLVHDGSKQWGPYPTAQLIELLRSKRVDWQWNIWRDGMTSWAPAGRLFTIPELSEGKLELRDFRQGDGTY